MTAPPVDAEAARDSLSLAQIRRAHASGVDGSASDTSVTGKLVNALEQRALGVS